MTDKEIFRNTFDKLHASPEITTEVLNMTKGDNIVSIKKRGFARKAAVMTAVLVLVAGSAFAAYAMDVGGVQRMVQVWIHGEQTDATFTVENGSYTLDYKDAEGNDVHHEGGGVAYENGIERPLTEEELLEEINMPDVQYYEDGTVWVYYKNQKMEITDKFRDGVCFVKLEAGDDTQYITVKYKDGLSSSPHGYIQPDEFN